MKQSFSFPKLVKCIVIREAITIALVSIIAFLALRKNFPFMILAIVFFAAMALGSTMVVYRNSFSRFKIDSEGLTNGAFSIKWEEVDSYGIIECNFYPVDGNITFKISCPSALCFGHFDENKKIQRQAPYACVFMSMTKSHLLLLKKYGKGRSATVDEILNKYSTVV